MGWSLVTTVHGNPGVNAPSAVSVTAGNLIVVFWSSIGASSGTFTVSDTGSTSYGAATYVTSDRPSVQGIRVGVATSSGSITVTTVPSGTTTDFVHVAVFAHDGGTIPGTVNASNSGVSTQTCTVTTSVANCLLLGFGDASSSNDEGSGFTALWKDVNAVRVTSEYKLTSSSGANTVALVQGTQRSILGIAVDPPGAAVTVKNRRGFGSRVGSRAA